MRVLSCTAHGAFWKERFCTSSPSPKLRCARRISITFLPPRLTRAVSTKTAWLRPERILGNHWLMNDPFQQRAAQKQTGNRQAVDQLLARLKGLISCHSYE
jgi:hypothetical protein